MTETTSESRRRPQLPNEVAAHLRERIIMGNLRQGEYLRMDTFANELGISVTPVREALLTLRGEGFVELEPRQGFAVTPLSKGDLLDIYEAQAMLAGQLLARATRKIDTGGLTALESLQANLESAYTDSDLAMVEECVRHFHARINRIAESAKLTWFFKLAARYAPQDFARTVHGWADACVTDHGRILDSVREHDAQTGAAVMREHIVRIGELLAGHLDEQGVWAGQQ